MTNPVPLDVKFISQDFEFIPEVGVSGYVKLELVRSYQPIDGVRNREFLYHRYSWSTDSTGGVSGFQFLRELPFGLATVSGA